MISKEAQKAKSLLEKEVVDQSVSLSEERFGWEEHARTQPLADDVEMQSKTIAGVKCLLLSPKSVVDDKLVIYAHGGGLVVGSLTTHRTFVSYLAKKIGRNILMIGYGLLPENDFSKPMQDISVVYCNLIENQSYKPQQIYFAGDSSGAGVALSSLVGLRENEIDLPQGFIAISAAFDVSLKGATMRTNDDKDPVLSYEVLRHWQAQYFAGKIALDHPHISPIYSSLSQLPDMLLIAGGDEVWLDDSIRASDQVNKSGGVSHLIIFDKMWHVFPMDHELPESILTMEHIKTFLDTGSPTH